MLQGRRFKDSRGNVASALFAVENADVTGCHSSPPVEQVMLFHEGKRLLRLVRLGYPFYILRVDDLAGVWMKNTGVDTARVLDVKGKRVRRLA
jgi:hypothetical protein